jgi:hypothetical protein
MSSGDPPEVASEGGGGGWFDSGWSMLAKVAEQVAVAVKEDLGEFASAVSTDTTQAVEDVKNSEWVAQATTLAKNNALVKDIVAVIANGDAGEEGGVSLVPVSRLESKLGKFVRSIFVCGCTVSLLLSKLVTMTMFRFIVPIKDKRVYRVAKGYRYLLYITRRQSTSGVQAIRSGNLLRVAFSCANHNCLHCRNLTSNLVRLKYRLYWQAGSKTREEKEDCCLSHQLLIGSALLQANFSKLVPVVVSYDDFWKRYLFREMRLREREVERENLILKASLVSAEEEEMPWEDDDNNDNNNNNNNNNNHHQSGTTNQM